MNLRMIGLAAVVAVATLFPLAASAGTAGVPGAGSRSSGGEGRRTGGAGDGAAGSAADLLSGLGAADGAAGHEGAHGTGVGEQVPPHASERCGPELASPDRVVAQTCVLSGGGETWARTYYRNATGEELTSVLTLMGPGGRTWQTNCRVEGGDEPGTCETPREGSLGTPSHYFAIAEFAAAWAGADAPLLLRSGSNSRIGMGR
ncbi:hypothetical protein J7E88_18070 [Streptomyces sp. ISL-10]|uniref:hypothetical protein n=1 Tax=Streptomyces sp. ISL-10 TaxID=2819172 RepID=UPI001BEBD355|nr:hypothetical protein [Streptomyces sp. ISL-10]MBT2367162.1 hypothetical protein [Streptomyces sp. ISL-10]